MIKRMFRTKRQNTNLSWRKCCYLVVVFELFPLYSLSNLLATLQLTHPSIYWYSDFFFLVNLIRSFQVGEKNTRICIFLREHTLIQSIKLRGNQKSAQIPLSRGVESSSLKKSSPSRGPTEHTKGAFGYWLCVFLYALACLRQQWDIQRFAVMLRPYVLTCICHVRNRV